MKKGNIEFKGMKDGIYVLVKKGSFEEVEGELDRTLSKSRDFFKGAKVLGVKSDQLSDYEKNEIMNIIKYRHRLEVAEDLSDGAKEVLGLDEEKEVKEEVYEGINEGSTKFINSTIRSGQVIEYEGNVVIIGDVNPGALIKARGNIIILGSLKGTAHAGDNGNREALVAAYDLQATQLRIADKISRKPDGQVEKDEIPEVARIQKGEIYIEPYLSRR